MLRSLARILAVSGGRTSFGAASRPCRRPPRARNAAGPTASANASSVAAAAGGEAAAAAGGSCPRPTWAHAGQRTGLAADPGTQQRAFVALHTEHGPFRVLSAAAFLGFRAVTRSREAAAAAACFGFEGGCRGCTCRGCGNRGEVC